MSDLEFHVWIGPDHSLRCDLEQTHGIEYIETFNQIMQGQ